MTTVDYTGRDYEAIRQALIDRIPDHLPEWTSRSPNDFGIVMLELFAHTADLMNYYADRVANEAFIGTAVLESSVYDIARMVGYEPKSVKSAVGLVNFTLSTGRTGDVLLNAGTLIQTTARDSTGETIFFSVVADHVIEPADVAYNDVAVVEGRLFTNETLGTSSGGPGQVFVIPFSDLDTESLVMLVDNREWRQVISLMSGEATAFTYSLHMLPDRTYAVVFGDGVNGAIPAPGQVIRISGRRSAGSRGNVDPNTATVLVNPILGITGVTNPVAMSGGQDRETVDQIRATLPEATQAMDRAVTLKDYDALAASYPGVARAQATASVYTNVTVYIVAIGTTGIPNPVLRDELQAYLLERSLVNVSVGIEDAIFVPLDVRISVKRFPDAFPDDVVVSVEAAIRAAIHWTNPVIKFNTPVTLSQIYQAVDGCPGSVGVYGVDYSVVTDLWKTGETQELLQTIGMDIGEFPTIGTVTVEFI